MRWVRAVCSTDFTRCGFSVVLTRFSVTGDGGTGSGAAGTTRWRALEFSANTPCYAEFEPMLSDRGKAASRATDERIHSA
jgi:hypothetical protein